MDEPIQHPTQYMADFQEFMKLAQASPRLTLLLIGVTALATAGSLMLLFVALLR